MGLFVAEDGRYQGWLAALLCCCAAVDDDESPIENQKSRSPNRTEIYYEQSQSLKLPSGLTPVVTLNAFRGENARSDGTRQWFRVAEQPPSLRPLDFGEKPLLGGWPYRSSSPVVRQRPSISAPYEFRCLDHTIPQKQGLIPLRLGPVVLRDSPITPSDSVADPSLFSTHNHDRSGSMDDLLANEGRPQSYRENREFPFQRCVGQNAIARPTMWRDADVEESTIAQPSVPEMSSSRSFALRDTEATNPRASSERRCPRRKRSFPLVRRDGNGRLEQEIQELNTIVEEKRAENARDNSPGQHIPAVAPSMQVRARSETLNSIGSALSRPLPTQGFQRELNTSDTTALGSESARRSMSSSSWASSRFSGWLSNIVRSPSPTHLADGEPFYKCQPPRHQRRTLSEASTSTSTTELESPSLTTASSPVSYGHTRNLTDDSRISPMSPVALRVNLQGRGKDKHNEDQWPFITIPTTEVGLAL